MYALPGIPTLQNWQMDTAQLWARRAAEEILFMTTTNLLDWMKFRCPCQICLTTLSLPFRHWGKHCYQHCPDLICSPRRRPRNCCHKSIMCLWTFSTRSALQIRWYHWAACQPTATTMKSTISAWLELVWLLTEFLLGNLEWWGVGDGIIDELELAWAFCNRRLAEPCLA